jgi:hypothetical protein
MTRRLKLWENACPPLAPMAARMNVALFTPRAKL